MERKLSVEERRCGTRHIVVAGLLCSVVAHAVHAQAQCDAERAESCRPWKALLLQTPSPVGAFETPEEWRPLGSIERFSINADGLVVGCVRQTGGSQLLQAMAWRPTAVAAQPYAIPTGTSVLAGTTAQSETVAMDVSDAGIVVGQFRGAACVWDLAMGVGPVVVGFPPALAATSSALVGIDRLGGDLTTGWYQTHCDPPGTEEIRLALFGWANSAINPQSISLHPQPAFSRVGGFGVVDDTPAPVVVGTFGGASGQNCDGIDPATCIGTNEWAFRALAGLSSVQSPDFSSYTRMRDAQTIVGALWDPATGCDTQAWYWGAPSPMNLHSLLGAPGTSESTGFGVRWNGSGGTRAVGAVRQGTLLSGGAVWDVCDGYWEAVFPVVPWLVMDLDPAAGSAGAVWRPAWQSRDWRTRSVYDVAEEGAFVGTTACPVNRIFVSTLVTDIDGSLSVDGADVLAVYAALGTNSSLCTASASDCDFNGVVNIADIYRVVADFTMGDIVPVPSFCCMALEFSDTSMSEAFSDAGFSGPESLVEWTSTHREDPSLLDQLNSICSLIQAIYLQKEGA
jgi:hypothetical protein